MAKRNVNEQYQKIVKMLTDEKVGNARLMWSTTVGSARTGFNLEGWLVRGRGEIILLQVFDHGVEIYSPHGVPVEFENLFFWLATPEVK